MCVCVYRPLSQVGTRRKWCPGQFGQDGMSSTPATPSTKHASCFPPSSLPASIEISIKLVVCAMLYRRNRKDALVFALVVKMDLLDVDHARKTYPREADDCHLADLVAKWKVTSVR